VLFNPQDVIRNTRYHVNGYLNLQCFRSQILISCNSHRQRIVGIPNVIDDDEDVAVGDGIVEEFDFVGDACGLAEAGGRDAHGHAPSLGKGGQIGVAAERTPQNAIGELIADIWVVGQLNEQRGFAATGEAPGPAAGHLQAEGGRLTS